MTETLSDLGKLAEALWLGVRKIRLGQGRFSFRPGPVGDWERQGTGPEGETWRLVDV